MFSDKQLIACRVVRISPYGRRREVVNSKGGLLVYKDREIKDADYGVFTLVCCQFCGFEESIMLPKKQPTYINGVVCKKCGKDNDNR